MASIFSRIIAGEIPSYKVAEDDKHYAFLRNYKGRTLLVAANFSGNDADIKLTIPSHAFDWMNIVRSKTLYPGKSIKVQIPAKKAAIIELI